MANSKEFIKRVSSHGTITRVASMVEDIDMYYEAGLMGSEDALCMYIDIKEALSEIDATNADVLRQNLIEGYTYREIAIKYERSVWWVNNRFYKGLIEVSYYLETGKNMTDKNLTLGLNNYEKTLEHNKRAMNLLKHLAKPN